MLRVIPEDVLTLVTTTRDVTPFLRAASALVTTYLGDAGLDETVLAEIERWWAAHLIAIADQPVLEKRFGNTALKFQAPKVGMGLQGTAFGQQVLMLDSTGILGELGLKRARIQVD